MTQMGKEEKGAIFEAPCLKKMSLYEIYSEEVIMEEDYSEEDSTTCTSLSSSEAAEDASSPPSCPPPRSPPSSSSSPDGPLFELSELMAQLPIKRGLSRYYQGKSQSYTSLASVRSVEDLAKKDNYSQSHYKMKMKWCRRSYGWGLDDRNNNGHRCFSPKATISKKASSRGSCVLSSLGRKSVPGL